MHEVIDRLYFLIKSPLFIIILIGVIVRLVLFPLLVMGYDFDIWATIIRNIQMNEGLYGLDGYFYTPIWGYILSLISFSQESLFHIDIVGLRVTEIFEIESYGWAFTSTVTSIEFNFWTKMPFLISDLIVGYLIYWIIKDFTGDKTKATVGFAMWFLCPLVIATTSISGMFDTFSVLFTLLCVILIRRDNLFMAGIMFSFAVLTKFFPIYLVFILIAYILVKHRDDGRATVSIIFAASGAAIAFLILMMPQILDGSFMETISFITNRAGGNGGAATILDSVVSFGAIIVYAVSLLVALIIGIKLYRKDKGDLDKAFFKYIVIILSVIFLYPPTPQYLVLLIAFLSIYILISEIKLMKSWIVISIGGTLMALGGHFTLALSLGVFSDIISLDFLVNMIKWFQTPLFYSVDPASILYATAGIIQYIGILSIVIFFARKKYHKRQRGSETVIVN